jgi:hypothetical protein
MNVAPCRTEIAGQPQRLWFVVKASCELALDLHRCTEILDECGFLPTGRCGVVNFLGIPYGLNANPIQRLRLDMLDVIDAGGERTLEDRDDSCFHLRGRQAGIGPDNADDRDVERRRLYSHHLF